MSWVPPFDSDPPNPPPRPAAAPAKYPPLSEAQQRKLKLLSLVSAADGRRTLG